jgi:hypothetical protein
MSRTTEVDLTEDMLDVRDIIARFEYIEDSEGEDDVEEAARIKVVLDELSGNGGDEQWRGDWYPTGLIRDSYFQQYAMDLADDIGAIDRNASWPCNCIDWDMAATALRQDYSSVDIEGETYWYR